MIVELGEIIFQGPATNKTFTYKLASKTNFSEEDLKMNKILIMLT